MAVLVGLFCVYYLIVLFPWDEALPVLLRLNLALFVLAGGAAVFIVWLLRTWRFVTIARAHDAPISFREAYFYIAAALGLAAVTPLQVGEAFKLRLVRRTHGLSLPKLAALFLGERLIDVVVLAIVTAAALGATGTLPHWGNLIALAGAGVAALGLTGLAAAGQRAPRWSAMLFAGVRSARARLAILASTAGCWIATTALWMIALTSIDVTLGAPHTMALMGAVTFAIVFSAIPAGLGVSEVSAALLLIHYGVEPAAAHAGALALRGVTLLIVALAIPHALAWKTKSGAPSSA